MRIQKSIVINKKPSFKVQRESERKEKNALSVNLDEMSVDRHLKNKDNVPPRMDQTFSPKSREQAIVGPSECMGLEQIAPSAMKTSHQPTSNVVMRLDW